MKRGGHDVPEAMERFQTILSADYGDVRTVDVTPSHRRIAARGRALERQLVWVALVESALKDGTSLADITGTGFVTSKEGDALTAAHNIAVKDDKAIHQYLAKFSERDIYPLQVVGEPDRQLDVAHVRIIDMPPDLARPVELTTEMPVGGKPLYALCFTPYTRLSGIPGLHSGSIGSGGLVQTSIPFNKGCSGGPVFNQGGQVAAVTVSGNFPAQQAVTWVRSIADVATRINLKQIQRGTFTVFDGYGIFDDQLGIILNKTFEECMAACAASDFCAAFSYFGEKVACFLSGTYRDFRKDARAKSGIRTTRPLPTIR